MRSIAILPALVILPGCVVQRGTKVDLELVKSFRPGVTTRAQVEAQLGRPTTMVSQGELTTCSWTWARGTSFGSGESQIVSMVFGPDQVLRSSPTIATSRI